VGAARPRGSHCSIPETYRRREAENLAASAVCRILGQVLTPRSSRRSPSERLRERVQGRRLQAKARYLPRLFSAPLEVWDHVFLH
jgi:hypothetical protein